MGEDAKNISIPRLLIQPLVENALKHGMEGDSISITISISASIEDDTLILKVKKTMEYPLTSKKFTLMERLA